MRAVSSVASIGPIMWRASMAVGDGTTPEWLRSIDRTGWNGWNALIDRNARSGLRAPNVRRDRNGRGGTRSSSMIGHGKTECVIDARILGADCSFRVK